MRTWEVGEGDFAAGEGEAGEAGRGAGGSAESSASCGGAEECGGHDRCVRLGLRSGGFDIN